MALVCTIDATGISAPDYPTILAALQALYRGIYGQDVYLEPDSQDGQFLALLALMVSDCNSQAIAVFNAFSPAYAQGEGLSRIVKINGLAREVASYSTVTLTIVGIQGTVLQNAQVRDTSGNVWTIPAQVIIPASGTVTASAQCTVLGAVQAAAGAVNVIASPTYGWQSVTNAAAAAPGQPVETDAQLRQRQALSTALPSRTIVEGILGGLLGVNGVTRAKLYENATAATDANGVTAYTLAAVVEGGLDQGVANIIAARKTPGVPTQGSTTVTVTNVYGLSQPIKFYRPTVINLFATVNIKANAAYTSSTGTVILAALSAFVASLPIGAAVRITRLVGVADGVDPTAFDVTSITIGTTSPGSGTADQVLAFNAVALLPVANISLAVT